MDPLVAKLNRIKGQLGGITKMYQDEKQCVDIVRQIISARNALTGVARDLLTDEASVCFRQKRTEDLDKILKELFKY